MSVNMGLYVLSDLYNEEQGDNDAIHNATRDLNQRTSGQKPPLPARGRPLRTTNCRQSIAKDSRWGHLQLESQGF